MRRLWISLLVSSSAWAQGDEPPITAEAPVDPLARLIADLNQPGPEAERIRSDAIDEILAHAESEYVRAAVEFVSSRATAGEDEDRTATELLRRLDRALRSEHHPVYGRSDPARRSLALTAWAPCLFRIVSDHELAIRRGGEETEVVAVVERESWAIAALDMLRDLDPAARRTLVEAEELAGGDRLRNALRSSGHLRDLGFVPWLGGFLDDPASANDARYALTRLTFAETEFESRAQVEEWVSAHEGVRYVDLAERAVARYRAELRSQGSLADQRVADQAALFVDALASTSPPRWSRLQTAIETSQNAAIRIAVRQQLAETLIRRLAAGETLGSSSPARNAFFDYIRRFLGEGESIGHPDWIAVAAAVVDPTDAERTALFGTRLSRILESGDEAQRISGLRAQRRFPSAEARLRVLRTASRAVVESNQSILTAAVECLLAPGWSAPKPQAPDRQQWVDLLSTLLIGDGIPDELRQLAVDAAALRDGDNTLVDPVLVPLGALARNADASAGLRVLATARMSVFLGSTTTAEKVLQAAEALAVDPEAAIRRTLGQQWGSYLRVDRAFDPALEIAKTALGQESEMRVATAWIESLRAFDGPQDRVAKVLDTLIEVATAVAPSAPDDARRMPLIEALRTLAIDPNRSVDQWLLAVDGLIRLSARQALLGALQQRGVSAQLSTDAPARDEVIEALFRTAELWEPGELPPQLATWLIEATPDGLPTTRSVLQQMLALDARIAVGSLEQADDMAAGLENADGIGTYRQTLLAERARIELGQGKVEAGLERLRGAGDLKGPAASDAFRRAAEATEGSDSVPWAEKAYNALAQDHPLWRTRCLDYWERRVRFLPSASDWLGSYRGLGPRFEQQVEFERYQKILGDLERTATQDGG